MKVIHLQVVVFYVVTLCSDVVGHYSLGGLCCLHLQGELRDYDLNIYGRENLKIRNVVPVVH
jgi:hypothetical protein